MSDTEDGIDDRVSRAIVAVVLTWRGKYGLFKRSALVHHDSGLWHCVTGYLDSEAKAEEQALVELYEETGLLFTDLDQFETRGKIQLRDSEGNLWAVYTFHAETLRRKLALNWEHESYRWVTPKRISGFLQVPWLKDVLQEINRVDRA